MFNLNQAIADWRRHMAAGGVDSHEVLDELEGHIRDEIERQMRLGTNEQQAYQTAVARIGLPSTLKAEFAKLAKGNRPPRWMFFRTFYFASVACMLLINTWTLLEYEMSPLERLFGVCAVALICMYLVGVPYLLNSLSPALSSRFAKVIKLTSSLVWVWPIWALLEAEHIVHLEIGIAPTTVLWCLDAAVVLTALAYGLKDRSLPNGGGGPPPSFQRRPQPIPPTRPCRPEFAGSLSRSQAVDPIVQESLEAACGEASRLGHDFIGTEHVLLGLLKLAKGSFANVLRTMNVDREVVRMEIERVVWPVAAQTATAAIPLTPRARKAIRLAAREATVLKHSSVGAEHLFLGLLLEGGGVGARVLKKLGIQSEKARQEIVSELRARPSLLEGQ